MNLTIMNNVVASYDVDPQVIKEYFDLSGLLTTFERTAGGDVVLSDDNPLSISLLGMTRASFIVITSDQPIMATINAEILPAYPILICSDNSVSPTAPITTLSVARSTGNTEITNVSVRIYGV